MVWFSGPTSTIGSHWTLWVGEAAPQVQYLVYLLSERPERFSNLREAVLKYEELNRMSK